MSSLTEQKALLLPSEAASFEIGKRLIPKIGPNDVLIKVKSAALNPVDWALQAFPSAAPAIKLDPYPIVLGVDAAGIVEEVGSNVKHLQKGDRVLKAGSFGTNQAAFQEYTLALADIVAKIPSNISFDEAATVPLGLSTATIGLYHTRESSIGAGLQPPWEEGGVGKYSGKPFVVLGGASSVGQFVIQLAKLSGFSPIIATASEHNTALVKSAGATHVLSRSLPASEITSAIQDITRDIPIAVVYDAVSHAETQQLGWDILGAGGSLVVILPPSIDKNGQDSTKHLAHPYGNVNFPQNLALGAKLFANVTGWLESGAILPNKVELLPNGLLGVAGGFEKLKKNEVSGVKLIVRPQETAW